MSAQPPRLSFHAPSFALGLLLLGCLGAGATQGSKLTCESLQTQQITIVNGAGIVVARLGATPSGSLLSLYNSKNQRDTFINLSASNLEGTPAARIRMRSTHFGVETARETGEAKDMGSETAEAAGEPAPAEDRSKRVSLFERVTGSGRAAFGKKARKVVEIPEIPEVTENKGISSMEEASEETGNTIAETEEAPSAEVQPIEEASEETPGEVEEAVDEGNKLGGLDPEDRLATSEREEDLLDIPAFLRRQAN